MRMYRFPIEEVEEFVRTSVKDATDVRRISCTCGSCNGADGMIVAASRLGAVLATNVDPKPEMRFMVFESAEEVVEFTAKMLASPTKAPLNETLNALWAAWRTHQRMVEGASAS